MATCPITFAQLKTLPEDPSSVSESSRLDLRSMRSAVSCLLNEQQAQTDRTGHTPPEVLEAWENLYRLPSTAFRDAEGRVRNRLFDLDGDGVFDDDDRFPTDARFAVDTDRDGVPDPIDLFPDQSDRFSNDETVKTRVLLYPENLDQQEFWAAVRRWQTGINPYVQRHLSDQRAHWTVEIGVVDDQKAVGELPPDVELVKVIKPQASSTDDPHEGMWKYRWNVDAGLFAVAHEAGHLLGFDDRYDFIEWSELTQPTLQERLQRRVLVRDGDIMGRRRDDNDYVIDAGEVRMNIALKAKWHRLLDMAQHLSTSRDLQNLRVALRLFDEVLALNPNHAVAGAGRQSVLATIATHQPQPTLCDILLGGFDLTMTLP